MDLHFTNKSITYKRIIIIGKNGETNVTFKNGFLPTLTDVYINID